VENDPLSASDPSGLCDYFLCITVTDNPPSTGSRPNQPSVGASNAFAYKDNDVPHYSPVCANDMAWPCRLHLRNPFTKLKTLLPTVCGGGAFGYGGVGGHAGPVHGEILGLVEYDSRLGGAHGGLVGAGAKQVTGGIESMRTWNDWQAHTSPIVLGGIEIKGATNVFGKQINTESRDIGGLAQYEDGNL